MQWRQVLPDRADADAWLKSYAATNDACARHLGVDLQWRHWSWRLLCELHQGFGQNIYRGFSQGHIDASLCFLKNEILGKVRKVWFHWCLKTSKSVKFFRQKKPRATDSEGLGSLLPWTRGFALVRAWSFVALLSVYDFHKASLRLIGLIEFNSRFYSVW